MDDHDYCVKAPDIVSGKCTLEAGPSSQTKGSVNGDPDSDNAAPICPPLVGDFSLHGASFDRYSTDLGPSEIPPFVVDTQSIVADAEIVEPPADFQDDALEAGCEDDQSSLFWDGSSSNAKKGMLFKSRQQVSAFMALYKAENYCDFCVHSGGVSEGCTSRKVGYSNHFVSLPLLILHM